MAVRTMVGSDSDEEEDDDDIVIIRSSTVRFPCNRAKNFPDPVSRWQPHQRSHKWQTDTPISLQCRLDAQIE